jgi:hypothetical protein
MLSNNSLGYPSYNATDTEVAGGKVKSELKEDRQGTVSVQLYGDDSEEMARVLERSIFDPEEYERITADDLSIRRSLGAVGLYEQRQTEYELVTTIDFEIAWGLITNGSVDAIETVDLTNDIGA